MHETEGDGRGECERRVASVEGYTADERAAAAELVSWISYTHPLIHRVIQSPHSDQMRWAFALIPTAYMLLPDPVKAPYTYRRYGYTCRFNTPLYTRRPNFSHFKRYSRILTNELHDERLTVQERERFIRHLVERSFELIVTLTNPNHRRRNGMNNRFFLNATTKAPLLEGSPATLTTEWSWAETFDEAEFRYLTEFARRLSESRVRDLAYVQVSRIFESIVGAQQKFVGLIGEAQTESAFEEGIQNFLESSEFETVSAATAEIQVVPTPVENPNRARPSRPPPPAPLRPRVAPTAPSRAEPATPEVRKNRATFSRSEIDLFFANLPPAGEGTAEIDLEGLVARLARAVDLTNISLEALAPWDLQPAGWTEWHDQFQSTREGLGIVANALRAYRDQAATARAQFVRGRDALADLERWIDAQSDRVAALDRDRARELSPRAAANLIALHRDLPHVSIMAKQVIARIDQRLDLFDARAALTTDLSLLVMHAQAQSIGEDVPQHVEPVRDFLRGMVATLRPTQLTKLDAPEVGSRNGSP